MWTSNNHYPIMREPEAHFARNLIAKCVPTHPIIGDLCRLGELGEKGHASPSDPCGGSVSHKEHKENKDHKAEQTSHLGSTDIGLRSLPLNHIATLLAGPLSSPAARINNRPPAPPP